MNGTPTPGVACRDCALRRLGAFRANSAEELAFIQGFRQRQVRVAAGQPIVRQSERADLLTLYSGWAFRYKTLSDGRRQILNFLLPGDLIGLQDQVGAVSPHGVEALTPVLLCQFARERLWELFRQHPTLGYDVTWLSSHEEALVDENLLSAGRRTAVQRVAALLMLLYKRAASLGLEVDGTVPFPISQQHIADAAGLSLAHTHRTMVHLRKLRLYQVQGNRLALPNLRAVRRLADYFELPVPSRPLI